MPQDFLAFATELARDAGAMIRNNFTLGMKKEWKANDTPITATDLAVNQLVIDRVRQAYPDHGVLAEEGNGGITGSRMVWVCDPVDGTIPFSHGIPCCVFSLALVQDGTSILGVIYDPFLDRLYTAEKKHGAAINGKPLHVSTRTSLHNVAVGLGFWYRQPWQFFQLAQALDAKGALLLNVGSIAYMGSLVASGELGATIFQGQEPHDTAALKVIVEEAGGKVTDLFGAEQRYDGPIKGHIVSNGRLHAELVALVKTTALGNTKSQPTLAKEKKIL